ncbi:phage protein Gp27 family protein [Methylobacter tundripaludum]|uniref:phage protein Gp27 family protein n=1 Tax=Methylobacter tundripaludum TaxID=173365 RepID=UPI0004DEE62A|nr:phage protein Gp27 family protein [Methylobacter tundripaludum]
MAPRSAVELLPAAVLEALNSRLIDQAFSDYVGLAAWLKDQGFEISKTAVWRHGSDLQAKMEKSMGKARERMEIAKALRGASDDEKSALMEATEMVAMDQLMDMFEALSELDAAGRMSAVPKLVRAIADLNRSAIGSAKWKREFEAEIRKQAREEAAEELTQELKNDGISAELEASIIRILIGK